MSGILSFRICDFVANSIHFDSEKFHNSAQTMSSFYKTNGPFLPLFCLVSSFKQLF